MNRKIVLSLIFWVVLSPLFSEIEFYGGISYSMYGFHAEKGSVELDSLYHSPGVELGLAFPLYENWDLRVSGFAGIPILSNQFIGGESHDPIELSSYDQYKYYLNLSASPSYEIDLDDFFISIGPMVVAHDLVLSSDDETIDYLLSYTLGVGGWAHFEYIMNSVTLYGDIKGSMGLSEFLVKHDDFVYSYGAGLTVGAVWKL